MSADDLLQVGELMTSCADEPMDIAEATPVLLSTRQRIAAV